MSTRGPTADLVRDPIRSTTSFAPDVEPGSSSPSEPSPAELAQTLGFCTLMGTRTLVRRGDLAGLEELAQVAHRLALGTGAGEAVSPGTEDRDRLLLETPIELEMLEQMRRSGESRRVATFGAPEALTGAVVYLAGPKTGRVLAALDLSVESVSGRQS